MKLLTVYFLPVLFTSSLLGTNVILMIRFRMPLETVYYTYRYKTAQNGSAEKFCGRNTAITTSNVPRLTFLFQRKEEGFSLCKIGIFSKVLSACLKYFQRRQCEAQHSTAQCQVKRVWS
jgi:hypothetical protein